MTDTTKAISHKTLTDKQSLLVQAIQEGKTDQEAGEIAEIGTGQVLTNVQRSFAVQSALLEGRKARLGGSAAQKALDTMCELMSDRAPAATRFQAAKWVLEQAGHTAGGSGDEQNVPLHEMSLEQLEAFMARAQGVIDRGGDPPVISVTPDNGA